MQEQFIPVEWSQKTNVYEVNIRQYTPEGNFRAFATHLPRLKDMGIEVIWFMPVTPISQEGRKGSLGSYYACSDYCAINPEFGSEDDFRAVVKQAHDLHMKVIIDWVANHTGVEHVWKSPHPDFYRKNEQGEFYDAHGWDDVIDLNYENPALRLAMIDSMAWWVKNFDIDGFRCDMAMLCPLDFWRQARTELDKLKPLFWLAELDSWDNPDYMQVFDAAYTWKWMRATRDYITSGNRQIHLLDAVLMHYQSLYPKTALRAWFTSNHDENSWNGTEYEKYGVMAPALAVFNCLWQGIPLIYSGQELPNYKRLLFFDKDCIEWNDHPALHEFYKKLLGLRSSHPGLVSDPAHPPMRIATASDGALFCWLRKAGDREVLVVLNLSDMHFQPAWITDNKVTGKFTELFSNAQNDFDENRGVPLEPWAYQVWVR